MIKPLVYIASPYTQGDPIINTRCSIDIFNSLLTEGECVPISPLSLSLLPHLTQPRAYEGWMEYMLALVENCDAVLRVNAIHGDYFQDESPGASREVAHAERNGIPVFYSIDELNEWLTK